MKMDREMTIEDLLEKHPGATTVFLKRMMLCVGCPASGFHTLEDAAKLYGFKLDELCREVEEAIHCAERRSGGNCAAIAIC
jgi:hybrid cluster-associated redox disulfide protein